MLYACDINVSLDQVSANTAPGTNPVHHLCFTACELRMRFTFLNIGDGGIKRIFHDA